jgi:hypothetical protein
MKKEIVRDTFNAALSAFDPDQVVVKALRLKNGRPSIGGSVYSPDDFSRIICWRQQGCGLHG